MEIQRPFSALWIYLGIGFLVYSYGIRDGALILVAILCGFVFYRLLLGWR